jgi:hypothetical protein
MERTFDDFASRLAEAWPSISNDILRYALTCACCSFVAMVTRVRSLAVYGVHLAYHFEVHRITP